MHIVEASTAPKGYRSDRTPHLSARVQHDHQTAAYRCPETAVCRQPRCPVGRLGPMASATRVGVQRPRASILRDTVTDTAHNADAGNGCWNDPRTRLTRRDAAKPAVAFEAHPKALHSKPAGRGDACQDRSDLLIFCWTRNRGPMGLCCLCDLR